MKPKFFLPIVLVALLMAACQPSAPKTVIVTQLVYVTQAPTDTQIPPTRRPTDTPLPTATRRPTATKTPTATPLSPEDITATAHAKLTAEVENLLTATAKEATDQAASATAQAEKLVSRKEPGIYLVGENIAPGVWRSFGQGSDCYWVRLDSRDEIIDNHFGYAGGTMFVDDTDYSVEMGEECGYWELMNLDEPPVPDDPNELTTDKQPGIYLVNINIAPGTWRSLADNNSEGCYWSRNTVQGGIIDNNFGFAGGTIHIRETDFSVTLDTKCGNWTYVGP